MDMNIENLITQAMAIKQAGTTSLRQMCPEDRVIYAICTGDVDVFCDNWREINPAYQDKIGCTVWHWLAFAKENDCRLEWAQALDTAYPGCTAKNLPNAAGITPIQLLTLAPDAELAALLQSNGASNPILQTAQVSLEARTTNASGVVERPIETAEHIRNT